MSKYSYFNDKAVPAIQKVASNSYVAVSYTHLDVYKRQILYYHTINSCFVLIFYVKCIPVQYCAYFNQDNEGVYVKHGVS